MEKRTRNLAALGVLTVVAAVAFYWLMLFLLGNPAFRGGMNIAVMLEDGAGIKRGDRVQVQGVEVGSITDVALGRTGGVVVEARLDQELSLPADTRANVLGDVFGAHTLQLVPGDALARLEDGDTIRGAPAQALTALASELGIRAQAVLDAADSLLSPVARGDLQASAAELPSSIAAMRQMFEEMRAAAASLRRSVEAVETTRANELFTGATGAVTEFESSARALADAATAMERSMDALTTLLSRVEGGQGTLGRLVNDSTLYYTLENTIREMGALATDIRERPSRYINIRIFGG